MTEKLSAEEILDVLESTDDGYIHYSVLLPVITNLLSELSERDKARNQAIQDCIDIVSVTPGDENVIPKLESLKTKLT